MHRNANAELAIHDLQKRLLVLGYRLGDETEQGLFGEKTAVAVAAFKASHGLGYDDVIDQTTWTALKDASMQMGDRLLYLHMPHFCGRDIGELQGALSAMGFSCALDSNFGPATEQALRDFQENMGLTVSGVLDRASLIALLRFKHVWDGKRGLVIDGRSPGAARSVEILASTPVCIFGIDEPTRVIASRIANLAKATTTESRLVSASALERAPGKDMLLVGLNLQRGQADTSVKTQNDSSEMESVCFDGTALSEAQMQEALCAVRKNQNRMTLMIGDLTCDHDDATVQNQVIAACILDALCRALACG